jgi:hypothetical protein
MNKMYNCEVDLVVAVADKIAAERDKFLMNEFEARGYTLEMLRASDCWCNSYHDDRYDGDVYSYFVNGSCVLTVGYRHEFVYGADVCTFRETMDILGGKEYVR